MILYMIALFSSLLRMSDIKEASNEIITQHVEFDRYDAIVSKRSLKLYIEQFDVEKIYMTQDEVSPYFQPNKSMIEKSLSGYQRNTFSIYKHLALLIQNAIERFQVLEGECRFDLITLPWEQVAEIHYLKSTSFPKSTHALKERIRAKMALTLQRDSKKNDQQPLDIERRIKVLDYFSKKQREFEKEYQKLGEELFDHYIAIHSLKAILRGLDSHSHYFSEDERREIMPQLTGNYCGIGVVIRDSIDGPYISRVLPNSPAAIEGDIKAGDQILAIDHQEVSAFSYEELLSMMVGKPKSKIHLKVKRGDLVLEMTLLRKEMVIEEETIQKRIEVVDNNEKIVAVTLDGFFDNEKGFTAETAIKSQLQPHIKDATLKGVVLDLRRNGGGYLSQASKVTSLFIDGGVIVLAKYGNGQIHLIKEGKKAPFYNGPVVILISKASASASEIVAQALKDYGVAIIVGDEHSYGKGSMQYQTLTFANQPYCYTVTVARYYTISGQSNQMNGVRSDIIIPTEYAPYAIGERFLEYSLATDNLHLDRFASSKKDQLSQSELFKSFTLYQSRIDTKQRQLVPILNKLSLERRNKGASLREDPVLFEAMMVANDLADQLKMKNP